MKIAIPFFMGLAIILGLQSCAPKQTTESLPSEALEEKREKQARLYEVKRIKADDLKALYSQSSAEFIRLVEFIEEQELFRGLNPILGKAKRRFENSKPSESAGAIEYSNATVEIAEICKELSVEKSLRIQYRRHFDRLEDRISDEHKRLKREFGI